MAVGDRRDGGDFAAGGVTTLSPAAGNAAARVLRQDVVANVWPLKLYIPLVCAVVVILLAWLMGGSPLLWAVLAGAVVLALLCGVLGWGCCGC